MMIASYLERHTWHSVLHCGHRESSRSFVGVCTAALKHNSSRSDKRSKMAMAFQHTQSFVLEMNQECTKLNLTLRGTLQALKVSLFFLFF